MARTHGSHHPALPPDRRARRSGGLHVLAPGALAPGRAGRGTAAGTLGPHRLAHQGAGRLRRRPAAAAPGPRTGAGACVRLLGLHRPAGDDRQLHHEWPCRDGPGLAVRRVSMERGHGHRECLHRTRARVGRLLRGASDGDASRPAGVDPGRVHHPRADLLHRADGARRRRVRLRPRARPPRPAVGHPRRAAEPGTRAARDRNGGDRLRRHGLDAHPARARVRRLPGVLQAPPHHQQRAERLLPQPGAARRAAEDGPRGRAGGR